MGGFVVSGDEELARLGLHEDLALFERNLEYWRVFVRAHIQSLPYAFSVGWPREIGLLDTG
jgi:hypothetical protein